MALPKIQYPVHVTNIAGIGDVSIRPFSGHEEKALLTTKESNESKEIVEAMSNVINACTFGKYDTTNLALFQVEQLFMEIRRFSVGPTADVSLDNNFCDPEDGYSCPKRFDIEVPIDNIAVETVDGESFDSKQHKSHIEKTIMASEDDKIGLIAVQPPISRITEVQNKAESERDQATASSIAAIEKVFDAESVYTDFDDTELIQWYDDLPFQSRRELAEFISYAPTLVYRENHTCKQCGKTHEIKLEGLNSFFT